MYINGGEGCVSNGNVPLFYNLHHTHPYLSRYYNKIFYIYLFWGIEYSGWTDSGLISFIVPLILLGLLTIWLGNEKEKESRKLVKK